MLRAFKVYIEPHDRAQSPGDSADSDTPIYRTFFSEDFQSKFQIRRLNFDCLKRFAKTVVDILAILAQLSGCFLWAIPELTKSNWNQIWLLPTALILTSFGWWENYVDKHSPFGIKEN